MVTWMRLKKSLAAAHVMVVAGVLLCCPAYGAELVIRLQSGNAVTVHYSGTIQGVTVGGGTDALAGFETTGEKDEKAYTSAATKTQVTTTAARSEAKGSEPKRFKLQWAKPRSED